MGTTVGLAAVKYADPSQNRSTNYQFTLIGNAGLTGQHRRLTCSNAVPVRIAGASPAREAHGTPERELHFQRNPRNGAWAGAA